MPINYFYDEGYIYSHSLPGLKISALRENTRGCLQVDQVFDDARWRSVLAFGDFEEISDVDGRAKVINRLFTDNNRLSAVESQLAPDVGSAPIIAFGFE